MGTAEAPDLGLDAALLVRAGAAGEREEGVEEVVRAQGDEAVRLLAAAAAQDLLHRRGEIVVADRAKDAAEEAEGLDVPLEEGLLRVALEAGHEGGARVGGAQEEEPDTQPPTPDLDLGLAPVDLGLLAGQVYLGNEGPGERLAELTTATADVLAHRRLGDVGSVLSEEALPDPLGRVALLPGRLAVGEEPLVDERPVGPKLRRRPARRALPRRRERRSERLADSAAVDAKALRERPDRQPLSVAITPDLLEQLHPRSHPLCAPPVGLQRVRTVGLRSDGGGAKSGRRSGANSDRRTHTKGER